MPAEVAEACFGGADSVLVGVRDGALWLMALADGAVGGLILKRRNARGDRAVLVIEQLGHAGWEAGVREAEWDEVERGLRVGLRVGLGAGAGGASRGGAMVGPAAGVGGGVIGGSA